MNVGEWKNLAREKGWKCVSDNVCGIYNGFPFSARFTGKKSGAVTVGFQCVGKGTGKWVRAVRKALPKGCSFVIAAANSRYTLTCTAPKGGDLAAVVLSAMDAATAVMKEAGLCPPEICPICKQGNCEATAMIGGAYVSVHRTCVEEHGNSARARADKALKGNYATGLIGAVLGGAVGAIPAIVCLNFMDYYVAVLYALIPLAAYHGYRIFKGKMDGGALACSILSSLVNLFTVEYFSIYIQLGLLRHSFPTPGFAWRVFTDYVGGSGFVASILMDVVFLGLGLWFTWGQIRRTAVHDVQDAGLAAASLLVNGRDPGPAAPAMDGAYQMVTPEAPRSPASGDPWDN